MTDSFTCPVCGRVSHYPRDVEEGYCGRCHDWTREVRLVEMSFSQATIVPPAPHLCQACAVDHEPEVPHDQQSLHYQYWFYQQHERWPTWRDAMAHCDPEVQEQWIVLLAEHGVEA